MPNWCQNILHLQHPDRAQLERAKQAFEQGRLLAEFIPVPEDLQIVSGFVGADNDPKQQELVAAQQNNIVQYGYKDWYDFCIEEWGTKWDVGDDGAADLDEESNHLMLHFDSAWSPPLAAYAKFEELGFEVLAYYHEAGMGFAGMYQNGEDQCFDGWSNAEQARNILPDEIDETFAISENLEMWEQESE